MQSKFKVGEKVTCVATPQKSAEYQKYEDDYVKQLGVGTIVEVPARYAGNFWAAQEDIAWVIWENDDNPKWCDLSDLIAHTQ